jgi:hypothetical protein
VNERDFLVQIFARSGSRSEREPEAEKGGTETQWDGTRGTIAVEDAWLE